MTNKPELKTTYRGYSSIGNRIGTRLYDVELVNQDLLNHFNTLKNTRPRDANYGSLIPDLLFELKTQDVKEEIVAEVLRIIGTEERVALQKYDVTEGTHTFMVECELYYIGLDVQNSFKVNFDAKTLIVTEIEDKKDE